MTQATGTQSGTGDPTQSGGAPAAGTTDPTKDPATGTDPTQSGQTGTPPAAADTVSRADFEAIQARMVAADRRATAAEKAIKDAADAQLSEAEKTANALKETQAALEKEKQRNEEQAVENAILADQTYSGKWHNPQTALSLVDRSMITFDDKGKPQGVKAALDKLAKDHAYLLKPAEGAGTGNEGKGGSTGAPGAPRQQGTGTGKTELEKRFPAMRGRVS